MSYELPNHLKLTILGNWEILAFSQNFLKLLPSAQSPTENENFVRAVENRKSNFSRSALFHMKTRVCLKYFVNDCKSLS